MVCTTQSESGMRTLELGFPMDVMPWARAWQAAAMEQLVSVSPSEVTRNRARFLERLWRKIGQLKVEEEELHRRMPDHVERIMKGKRIL
eukprot:6482333-Amphidinium_carterae.1